MVRKLVPLNGVATAPPPVKPAIAGKLIWATPENGEEADATTLKLPDCAGL